MRKTFQRWLFVFIATAFTIMFLFSLYIQTWQARRNTLELIHLKIGDIQKQIARNDQHIKMLYNFLVERSLVKIYAFAKMVEYNPNLEYDFDELKKVQNILQVDELHISDEKGILIASTESTYLGYDMNSQDQSRPFMEALVNPDFVLIQDPQPRGINGELFSYAGVARRDKPGILQIGIHPKSLEDAMEIAAIENLAPGFRIGNEGQIIICQDGKIVSIEDEKWLGKNIGEYLNVDPSILEKNFGSFNAKIEGVANIFRFERFHDHVIIGSLPNKEMYFNRRSIGTTLIVANVILFLVVFFLVSQLVQKIVIDGIYQVNDSLRKITDGNLQEVVHVETSEEFCSLSSGINSTVTALKNAIGEAKKRIEYELECARTIQSSALPNFFPPFPDRTEFDLFATMDTAREVGGDFYDFMFIDSDHLAFYIADVSGKGIPAALFMMTAKTVLKDLLTQRLPLTEVARQVNNYLCENNTAQMFVTAFLAILEISTGKVKTVNCGHNYPLWLRKGSPVEWIDSGGGFMLGGMPDIEYGSSEYQLLPGDRIFLYTDGVTEALDRSDNLYGDDRLKAFMDDNASDPDLTLSDLLKGVRENVRAFTGDAVQSDDITMLGMIYNGCVK